MWFGATEGFEKFLQGLFKKTVCQPGQVRASVQHAADCSLWDSCPAMTWGRQSLLESEPGLLSSVWNLWHYTTQAAHSLLLKQMELIPGQRLLCKYSQEQPPWSAALPPCTDSSQHPITPWHGQAQCTGNVLVPIPTGSWLLPQGSKSRVWVVREINAALLLHSDRVRPKMIRTITPGKVVGKCWIWKLLAVYSSWLRPVLCVPQESLSTLRSEHPSSRQDTRLPCRSITQPHTSTSSPLLPPWDHLLSPLCEDSLTHDTE